MDIKTGSKGDLVKLLQKRLTELAFSPGIIDGVFGAKTKKAIVSYQKKFNLTADGIVGNVTAEKLGIAYAFFVPELERRRFKHLLAANPNYFGNYPDSDFDVVKPLSKQTKYEQIDCLGYHPDTRMLSATLQVKLPYGYAGNQCGSGSLEHVRFYIDYGAGDGWQDLGLGAVKVWDIPNQDDCTGEVNKPLDYVVSISIEANNKYCFSPVLPTVRAILSWQALPPADSPDWTPVWGNVVDKVIQLKPKPWLSIVPIEAVKEEYFSVLETLKEIPQLIPIDIPGPPPVEFTELAKLYSDQICAKRSSEKVEPSRFGHSALIKAAADTIADPSLISTTLAEWKSVNLDFSEAFTVLEQTTANVSYEELHCLGLDPNRDWLHATFTIKRPYGYSGNLCKQGSKEYIAFWADWNDVCAWKYLDTVSIDVHDIEDIPEDGLNYSVYLPVDLDEFRRGCSEPKIARIRAVLSWNQAPSTVDPDDLRHYGNRIDTHIQIRPAAAKLLIERIGGVSISQINYFGNGRTKVDAQMMPSGTLADYWGTGANECPFGGSMYIVGKLFNSGKYRLVVRPYGIAAAEEYVKTRFWITKGVSLPQQIVPDPVTGFVQYADVYGNHDSMLGRWSSGGDSGKWEIQLQRVKEDDTLDKSPWYSIYLDNKEAHAEISLDAGACKSFVKGEAEEISGRFIATDTHFAGFQLRTTPTSITPPAPQTPGTVSTSTGSITVGRTEAVSPGRVWKLDVKDLIACGYVVEVRAFDQTIRNNNSNAHSYARDDVGFCVLDA